MKIAISGSHDTGKTTLLAALHDALPAWSVFDEPYRQLEDEGYDFPAVPGLVDFERQLERAIATVTDCRGDGLFDRGPVDILAYLVTHEDAAAFDPERWLPAVEQAVRQLDLIVFVPIEDPDRIEVTDPEFLDWRRRVHEELQEMVMADSWGFGVPALEVTGSVDERARQVLGRLTFDSE